MPSSEELAAIAAASAGDVEKVVRYLGKGGNARLRVDNYTLLCRAAGSGSAELTKAILKHRCSVNARCGAHGDTALIAAAKAGCKAVAKQLVAHPRCSLDAANNDGVTALMAAAEAGATGIMRALLQRGASTECETRAQGHTALTLAVASGNQEAVDLLLEYGANIEHRTNDGMQPKDIAWDLTESGPSGSKRAIVEALMRSEARRQECKTAIGVAKDVIKDRYRILRILGGGSFGTVFVVRDLRDSETEVKAVKAIPMPETVDTLEALDEGLHEARMMLRIVHPGIVRIFEYFDANKNYCIVMEHCELGDLSDWIKGIRRARMKFPVNLVLHWFLQMLMALHYLHSNNIMHRDLKPKNVFVKSDGTTRIGDFGLSRRLLNAADFASTFAGTFKYLSPEVLQKELYDLKCDIWSLGCTLYELCYCTSLFQGTNVEVKEKILRSPIPHLPEEYPKDLDALFRGSLMLRDPRKRASTQELVECSAVRKELQRMQNSGLAADQLFLRDNRGHIFDSVDSSVGGDSDVDSDDSKASSDTSTLHSWNERLELVITDTLAGRPPQKIEGAEAAGEQYQQRQKESVSDDIRRTLEQKRKAGFPLDDVMQLLREILQESPDSKRRKLKRLTDDLEACELVEMLIVSELSLESQ